MKSYPPEIDELMARCLAGESSREESIRLEELLAADADLKTDFEILKLFLFDTPVQETETDQKLKNKFNEISRRLEDDAIM